jgi:hypothetical protein
MVVTPSFLDLLGSTDGRELCRCGRISSHRFGNVGHVGNVGNVENEHVGLGEGVEGGEVFRAGAFGEASGGEGRVEVGKGGEVADEGHHAGRFEEHQFAIAIVIRQSAKGFRTQCHLGVELVSLHWVKRGLGHSHAAQATGTRNADHAVQPYSPAALGVLPIRLVVELANAGWYVKSSSLTRSSASGDEVGPAAFDQVRRNRTELRVGAAGKPCGSEDDPATSKFDGPNLFMPEHHAKG